MQNENEWNKTIEFHGHTCMGIAMGFRCTLAALKALSATRRHSLFAVAENVTCGVDALQVLAGCTTGKRNLVCKDVEKPVYRVARTDTRHAVRVTSLRPEWSRSPEHSELRARIGRGSATETEKKRFSELGAELVKRYLEAPEGEVCLVEQIDYTDVKPE